MVYIINISNEFAFGEGMHMFQIYLGLDILMAVVMSALLLSCFFSHWHNDKQPRLLLVLISADIIMLLTNAALQIAALSGSTPALQIAYCFYNVAYSAFMSLSVFYLTEHIRRRGAVLSWRLAQLSACISGLNAVFWCVSSYNGMFYDIIDWSRGPFYWCGQIGGAGVFLLYLYLLLRFRNEIQRRDFVCFSLFMLCPALNFVLRQFAANANSLALAFSVALLFLYEFVHSEQLRDMREIQLQLSEARFSVLESQIRPHFLYNTMNSIYYLCEKDPAAAKKAILDFSEYMRANLRSTENGITIPFSQEMAHIDHYLSLEKLRFQELLTYSYEIGIDAFQVPPLTIQILVENAVKHGLEEKPEGGSVLIRTEETADSILVTVEDNGVGFPQKDLSAVFGLGLVNARERLREFCGAALEINSTEGKGTTAVVRIPKKDFSRG